MRIVNKIQFMVMPAGTLFSKYEPCIFDHLCIKGNSIIDSNDFFYQDIVSAIEAQHSNEFMHLLEQSEKNGISMRMDLYIEGRDGLFKEDELFAIWERKDVVQLIERLQKALKDGYGKDQ